MQLELFPIVESKSDGDVQCRNCKKYLPLSNFRHRSDRVNNYRVKSCKACEKEENLILKILTILHQRSLVSVSVVEKILIIKT